MKKPERYKNVSIYDGETNIQLGFFMTPLDTDQILGIIILFPNSKWSGELITN